MGLSVRLLPVVLEHRRTLPRRQTSDVVEAALRRWSSNRGVAERSAIVEVARRRRGAVQCRVVVGTLHAEPRVRLQAEDNDGGANEKDRYRGHDLKRAGEEGNCLITQ